MYEQAKRAVAVHHPQGAIHHKSGVRYVVWALEHHQVTVRIHSTGGEERTLKLHPIGSGYFEGLDPAGEPGDLYTFDLDERRNVADFASRFQPKGVNGPSMVVSSADFAWQCRDWKRPAWKGQIIYELHLGTFSPEGTFLGAIPHLDHLRDLGVTAVEIMPVAERAGVRNWGYDGVFLFAPAHAYGTPDDFRTLIDACHERGLAVVLDVVFNHLGPQGNVAPFFSSAYFHSGSETPWGSNFDLDGPSSLPVRELLKQNIAYWLEEFRMDGFRFDATHAIPDRSGVHLLAEIAELVHRAGGFLIAEDERNAVEVIEEHEREGWDFDAAWADDFHHGVRVSQDPSHERYYQAFKGTAAEIAETIEHGWLYRGRPVPSKGIIRGTECRHLAPEKFVYCISNHDQTGNRPLADRFHHAITPEAYRAVSLFLCLLPYTPMLFMGQEWAATSPFHFFTDFEGELGRKMAGYRMLEFDRLGLKVPPERQSEIIDPQSEEAFQKSKLNWQEVGQEPHAGVLAFYREALALRKTLQVTGNSDRTQWRVRAVGDVVELTNLAPEREVDVLFAVKKASDLHLPEGKVLLSSRPLPTDADNDGPATVVLERASSVVT